MSESDVTVVRVYLHEVKVHMEELLQYLHDESKVFGVTVFRGITRFVIRGIIRFVNSGTCHSSKLIDMSFDLPVAIEFFDTKEKVSRIIEYLNTKIEPGHIVY